MALNRKKLGVRALTLIIAGACLVFLVLIPPKWVFHLFLGVVALIGVSEFQKIAAGLGQRLFATPVIFCVLYGIAAIYVAQLDLAWLPYFALLITALISIAPGTSVKLKLPQFGLTLVAIGYLGFSIVTLAHLFQLGQPNGRHLFLFFLGTVWMGDSCAYLGGSLFGRHKIAPILSPKKTWEGMLANIIGNAAALTIAQQSFLPELNWQHILFLTLIFACLGFFGDLVESSWKRAAAIKDSSTLIPGHGGILDRVDSIFLTAPVFYFYIKYVLVDYL